ncbi:MAG TPA: hypothetical protein VFR58_18035 [Flavisolibacter sp.]|nr:hypothetical protein [Flavisolibacter sp.]
MDFPTFFSASASIVSTLIAMGALIISYRVYRIQKSIENENQFFTHKLHQYQSIIQLAAELHDIYYESFLDLKDILEGTYLDTDEIDQLAEAVDKKTSDFRIALYRHASFLPEQIIMRLDSFYNQLYEESEFIEVKNRPNSEIETLLDRLDKYEEDLESIINLMRFDLGVETIDRKLKRRTHR